MEDVKLSMSFDSVHRTRILKSYKIDFSKVNDISDIITILKGLNINITLYDDEDTLKELKPYLKEID